VTYSAAQEALAATVQDGGGTFYADTLLPCNPPTGFAVGLGGAVLDARFVTTDTLKETAKRVGQEWAATLIGTWLDGNTLYVDAVRIFAADRKADAITEGIKGNQLAIYDFTTRKSIAIPHGGFTPPGYVL
jgi:hypothetical protein